MIDKTLTTTVEILGKLYSIRCLESELKSLQQAAALVNQKMTEIQTSGKAINLERIAIITALNITHQFLQSDQQKSSLVDRINHQLLQLQNKLDQAINQPKEMELLYSTE